MDSLDPDERRKVVSEISRPQTAAGNLRPGQAGRVGGRVETPSLIREHVLGEDVGGQRPLYQEGYIRPASRQGSQGAANNSRLGFRRVVSAEYVPGILLLTYSVMYPPPYMTCMYPPPHTKQGREYIPGHGHSPSLNRDWGASSPSKMNSSEGM